MNYLKHPVHASWTAHSAQVKEMMGLDHKAHWPAEGMPPRQIQGFVIWVNPLEGDAPRNGAGRVSRRAKHRVMARCLVCGKEMSAGRTAQHKCVS
jgi:hypothetical protein